MTFIPTYFSRVTPIPIHRERSLHLYILPRNAFGFAIWLSHHQRITPYRLGQHTNSLVELVETNILFFTGFAFDRLSLPRAGRPTTGRQAYHGQAGIEFLVLLGQAKST